VNSWSAAHEISRQKKTSSSENDIFSKKYQLLVTLDVIPDDFNLQEIRDGN
jgi:hypothetical protein